MREFKKLKEKLTILNRNVKELKSELEFQKCGEIPMRLLFYPKYMEHEM